MHQETTSQRYVPLPDPSTASPATAGGMMHQAGCALRRAVRSRLLLITTVTALDGQLLALAATGALAEPVVVVTVAFTMIAGVGAFVTALQEADLGQAMGRRVFAVTAGLSILVNVAAAAGGLVLSEVISLEHVQTFAALALIAIAWEVGGGHRLRLAGTVPVPAVLVALGVLVEVAL